MVHEVRYHEFVGYEAVVAVCTCRLTAVSVNRSGAERIMRRKHKDQRIRARAKARG